MSLKVTYDKAQALAKETVEPDLARIKTDGKSVYPPLKEVGFHHRGHILGSPERAGVVLPWVHILISNAKRFIIIDTSEKLGILRSHAGTRWRG